MLNHQRGPGVREATPNRRQALSWLLLPSLPLVEGPVHAGSLQQDCPRAPAEARDSLSLLGGPSSCATQTDTPALQQLLADMAYEGLHTHPQAAVWSDGAFTELGRRGARRPSDWRSYMRLSLVLWRFDEAIRADREQADDLWLRGQTLPSALVPLKTASTAATLWHIDEARSRLIEHEWRAAQGDFVMVVFSPLCNPCKRAARDLAAQGWTTAFGDSCVLWAATVEQSFDIKAFARWEREFPQAPPRIVKDWSQFGLQLPTSTPAFHLFKRGRRAATISGWPPEGRATEIAEAIRRVGLAPGCAAASG